MIAREALLAGFRAAPPHDAGRAARGRRAVPRRGYSQLPCAHPSPIAGCRAAAAASTSRPRLQRTARTMRLLISGSVALKLTLALSLLQHDVAALPRRDVLMIAIDDMRPEISPYGFEHMETPNFQRIADRGTVFQRAYVSVAVCMPSRTAILTSRRPDTTMDWAVSTAAALQH